ncbi:hypothetical protein V492_08189, partial [Pseudogymnoascus sp. VKM F-4246]
WLGNRIIAGVRKLGQPLKCPLVHIIPLDKVTHELSVHYIKEWLGKLGDGFQMDTEHAGFAIGELADAEYDERGIKYSMRVIDTSRLKLVFMEDKARRMRLTFGTTPASWSTRCFSHFLFSQIGISTFNKRASTLIRWTFMNYNLETAAALR